MTIGAAVAAPIVVRGGFTAGSQWLFAGLATAALALALIGRRDLPAASGASVALAVLGALGLLGVASAGWSVAEPSLAIRTGAVVLAAAALALATALTARGRRQAWILLGLIAAIAVIEATVGSVAALVRAEPLAERLGGSWRPGGTFEYSPALALLAVTTLPVAVAAGSGEATDRRGRARLAIAAASASALGVALGLSDSRLALVLGFAGLAGAVALANRFGGSRRAALALAVAALVSGAVAAIALGGYSGFGVAQTEGDAGRVLVLAAILAVSAAAVTAVAGAREPRSAERPATAGTPPRRHVGLALGGALAAAGVALAIVAGASSEGAAEPVGVEGDGGVTHGRTEQWDAALAAGAERPLGGWGAGAYSIAAAEQGASFALYAHSLPLEAFAELGVPGLLLVLALYAACALAVWRARTSPAGLLAGWGVVCFGLANLVDWPWHLAGSVAVFAVLLGITLAVAREEPAR